MFDSPKDKSIFLIYLSALLQFQGFIGPVIFVFYTTYMGLSTPQYLCCDSILFLIMAFAEIPSGMLADYFGRKRTIIVSKFAICVGMVLLLTIKSFCGAIIVSIIYGIFGAMESGVAQSIYYEIFEKENSLDEFEGIQSKASSIGFTVSIIYAAVAGTIAHANIMLPVIFDLIVSVVSLVAIVILLEDNKEYVSLGTRITLPSKDELHNVSFIILFAALLSASSRTLFSFYQPLLVRANAPIRMLGVISGGYSIVAAVTALFYKKIRNQISKSGMYAIIIGLQLVSAIGISTVESMYVLIFIFLQQVQRGMMGTYLYIQINSYIDTNKGNRVTLMSVMYCTINVIVAVSLYATSLMDKAYNLSMSIQTYCIIINILILVSYLLFKYKDKTNKIHSFQ